MSPILSCSLLITVLPFVALGAQKRATPSQFELFGYGEGLGGPPMFFSEGFAYLGDPSFANSTDAATVTFSPGNDNMWIGNPNTTDFNTTNTPDWSDVSLFIPTSHPQDSRVGYISTSNSSSSNITTTGFAFYGSTAMLISGDGSLETLWTGLKLNNGVHALYWNDTSSGQIPLTLRRIGPSNPSSRRR